MRKPKQTTNVLGSIRRDEVLPVRVAARRLGWNVKGVAHAKRAGLKTQRFGRYDYVTGQWIAEFFERLANCPASIETIGA